MRALMAVLIISLGASARASTPANDLILAVAEERGYHPRVVQRLAVAEG